ncbi:hypothetical protein [Planococcus sp. YIM B11945]|uniref:hypothetical protein n=1 Tax=Planococcus sp. YIM B11945 TaxID=3435410 RepID=UPI003D7CDAFD
MAKLNASKLKERLAFHKQKNSVPLSEGKKVNYEKVKEMVEDEFAPGKGETKPHLSKVKKEIEKFSKATDERALAVDLMIFCVEKGTRYAKAAGDADEEVTSRLIRLFAKTAEECEKDEALFHQVDKRLQRILQEAAPLKGGYPEALTDLYYSISWLEDAE